MSTASIELADGRHAIVDEADLPLVAGLNWHAHASGDGGLLYARAWIGDARRLMHNLLTGWPYVDHVNGDGLDNRRTNLRRSNHSQNMANRRKGAAGSSRFKGVSWQKSANRWRAQIGVHGQRVYLGLFLDEVTAARAYDDAAREHFGSYAAVNFPEAGEVPCLR